MSRRVVITGLGATPVGNSVTETWEAIICVKTLLDGIICSTINHETPTLSVIWITHPTMLNTSIFLWPMPIGRKI